MVVCRTNCGVQSRGRRSLGCGCGRSHPLGRCQWQPGTPQHPHTSAWHRTTPESRHPQCWSNNTTPQTPPIQAGMTLYIYNSLHIVTVYCVSKTKYKHITVMISYMLYWMNAWQWSGTNLVASCTGSDSLLWQSVPSTCPPHHPWTPQLPHTLQGTCIIHIVHTPLIRGYVLLYARKHQSPHLKHWGRLYVSWHHNSLEEWGSNPPFI